MNPEQKLEIYELVEFEKSSRTEIGCKYNTSRANVLRSYKQIKPLYEYMMNKYGLKDPVTKLKEERATTETKCNDNDTVMNSNKEVVKSEVKQSDNNHQSVKHESELCNGLKALIVRLPTDASAIR